MTLYRLVNGDSILPVMQPHEAHSLATQGKFPDRNAYRDFIPRPIRSIINKALSVDPSKRFQSAKEMRHAIERVTIQKNWAERILQDGVEWSCGWNRKCYEVARRCRPDGKWDVVVRKGPAKRALRRISDLCLEGVNRTKAEQHSRRILQDFVLGKQK